MKLFNDPEVFARIQRLPPHVCAVVDELRAAALARGDDVVDLSAATPDGAAPPAVTEALRSAVGEGGRRRYQDPRGIPALREAAAAWYQRRRGVSLDADREVMATLGTREGIGHALIALLQERDAVLAPAPAHPIHAYGAVLAGGDTIPVPVGPDLDFMESLLAATERAGDRRPRGIVVNFPASPTGAVATPELLQKIVRFAEARNLFILSDLAYGDIVFDGARAPSLLQVPGGRDRTLEFVSLSKSYDMPGWRVGIAAGNHALVSALARVKSYLDDGPFGAVQVAASVALNECDGFVDEVRERYRRRRDALALAFGAAGWSVPPPAATLCAWAPIPAPLRHLGSLEFSRRLLQEAGVAVAPGVAFGAAGEGYVRIALVQDEGRVREAAGRVRAFLERAAAGARPGSGPAPRGGDPA
jgi:alanine-synthesizing transaminase